MAVLSWGKCGLETTPSVNGAPDAAAQWKAIDTPKENTTKITPTAGTEIMTSNILCKVRVKVGL